MAPSVVVSTIGEKALPPPQLQIKGAPVRHFRAIPILIAAVALAAVVAASALAATQTKVAFKGSYKGTVSEKIDGADITALANASGKGSVIGAGKLAGTVKAT